MNAPSIPVTIPVVQLTHGEGLPLPSYATPQSAGMDLLAAITDTIELAPGDRILVPTALTIALPTGYEAQVRPRSGLALNNGITLVNTPGTIDADYRGEIGVIMINLGKDPFTIERGARIAQLVIAPCLQASWMPTTTLDATTRGNGGFGSTGK
ncbi:deoxyuridine 5'-triphosphate nucleotidohydrolase [Rhodospirillales bacterium 47_12_T64]|nr:deoxyuridine 5'-triphosphate nucleotidohydrolase [Rhodospirillales bacterium 47_12_T64]